MTLGFSTKIKDKLTHFPEKIIRSLEITEPKKMTYYDLLSEVQKENEQLNIHEFQELKPKLHTIREDKKDRWKKGNDIHFVINNRTKNRFQFSPILKVQSVQQIEIKWFDGYTPNIFPSDCYKKENKHARVYINDIRFMTSETIKNIALNDGFDSVDDFFEYFNTNFKGKLIHWTSLTY